MASRTSEGKHTTRFIIEMKDGNGEFIRSSRVGIDGFFNTREEAAATIDPAKGFDNWGLKYRVRQK